MKNAESPLRRIRPDNDPIELTKEYKKIRRKLERKIKAKIGKKTGKGYRYLYWAAKKEILKEEFGIDWKSPRELNPNAKFD